MPQKSWEAKELGYGIQVIKYEYRISNKEYRTAEVRKNTSKFDIPCSIFCGSIINNP